MTNRFERSQLEMKSHSTMNSKMHRTLSNLQTPNPPTHRQKPKFLRAQTSIYNKHKSVPGSTRNSIDNRVHRVVINRPESKQPVSSR